MIEGKNIILFSSDDWHSGLKTSKYHIAIRLAKSNKVLFINSVGMQTPKLSSRNFRKMVVKLREWFKGYEKINDNLYVYTPIILPFHNSRIFRRINRIILLISIKIIQSLLKLSRPMIWIFTPNMVDLIGHLNETSVIYYCIDELSGYKNVNASMIMKKEQELLKQANFVIACSRKLATAKQRTNPNTYYIPHGVDWDLFSSSLNEDLLIPEDIAKINKPIIGFYGFISEDWIDFNLINYIATSHPEWSIVLIGKSAVNLSDLTNMKNVYFLGVKKFEELPKYNKAFDVAIIPFNINELTLNSNPLKLLEYLASGKPVVSVDIPEVRRYENEKDMVKIAKTPESFVSAIEYFIEQNSIEIMYKRSSLVRTESWDTRIETICNIISNHHFTKSVNDSGGKGKL